VTLRGFAPAAPTVVASTGTVGSVTYDGTTKIFTVPLTQAGGAATVSLK
jgi:hypothetical protein